MNVGLLIFYSLKSAYTLTSTIMQHKLWQLYMWLTASCIVTSYSSYSKRKSLSIQYYTCYKGYHYFHVWLSQVENIHYSCLIILQISRPKFGTQFQLIRQIEVTENHINFELSRYFIDNGYKIATSGQKVIGIMTLYII